MYCGGNIFTLVLLALNYTYPCLSSPSSPSKNNTHLCLPNQRDALLRFRNAYNITTWNEHVDCCDWSGIFCNNITGDVVDIHMSYSKLTGTIDNIAYILSPLHNLQNLNLHVNNLYGVIPPEFSQFNKLVYLSFGFNEGLRMESHSLELLVQNLTQLEYLDLSGLKISGDSSNALMNISTALKDLTLRDCGLKGVFPESIFHYPNLGTLDLHENVDLMVSLPTFNWTSQLLSLDLSSTNFSGKLPDTIGNLKYLISLDLSSCHISSPMPSSIGNLTQLTTFLLSSGTLEYEIPSSVCRLNSLEQLSLPQNKFSGMIPQCLGNLTYLRWLDLSANRLTGPFPPSLANCTSLEYLNVSANMISDTITPWLESFPNLKVVDLGANSFSGEIPLSICGSIPLIMDLSNNKLTGTISPCLVNYTNINYFGTIMNLRMNKLEGTIPDAFPQNCTIVGLDLSENRLEGPLPRSLVNCKSLAVLDLGKNYIEDPFPNWLETLAQLQILVLKSNKFHGEVKTMLNRHPFPNLRIFDMSSNNLTGMLPTSYIAQFDAMKDTELYSQTSLLYFDDLSIALGYKYSMKITMKGLTFTVPKVLKTLMLIDFSNNGFHGEIPEIIGDLVALKGLNLSHNNLTGNIPPSIQRMTNLEWLDLSSNKLTGWIPNGLTQLTQLGTLNLSHNKLTGLIPCGRQLDTFGKGSFVGNVGLCGAQIEIACGKQDNPPPPPSLPSIQEDDFDVFNWKIVLMGFGCGLVIGLSNGYIVLELRRPEWFATLVEEKLLKKTIRPRKRGNR